MVLTLAVGKMDKMSIKQGYRSELSHSDRLTDYGIQSLRIFITLVIVFRHLN